MPTQTTFKLCIELEGTMYATALIGYLSDGSYFLKDLSQREGVYNITKMRIGDDQMRTFGAHAIPIEQTRQWVTTHKPKLVHHMSGQVHVSGTGVKSGSFKIIKRPKGVQLLSPHFTDGGPMGVFTFWGLNDFEKSTPSSGSRRAIVFAAHEIVDLHPNLFDKENSTEAFTYELFYLDKSVLAKIDADSSIRMNHPHFGIVTLKILNHNTKNPALFGVMCRHSRVGWEPEHGVSYGAGTTALDRNGFFEQIQIMYPFTDTFKEFLERGKKTKIKNLDFNPKFRIWCLIDDWLHAFLHK